MLIFNGFCVQKTYCVKNQMNPHLIPFCHLTRGLNLCMPVKERDGKVTRRHLSQCKEQIVVPCCFYCQQLLNSYSCYVFAFILCDTNGSNWSNPPCKCVEELSVGLRSKRMVTFSLHFSDSHNSFWFTVFWKYASYCLDCSFSSLLMLQVSHWLVAIVM